MQLLPKMPRFGGSWAAHVAASRQRQGRGQALLTRPPRSTRLSSGPTSSADAEPTRALMRVRSVKGVSLLSLQRNHKKTVSK